MRAGRLDRRIAIQTATDGTADAYGVVPKTWATTSSLWAEDVTNKRKGKAEYNNAIENHTVDRVFAVRYEAGKAISPDQRIVYNGENYRILCPPIEGKGRYDSVELHCQRWGTDS
jgi:SPP1 family predicted phage head-tail adaptor